MAATHDVILNTLRYMQQHHKESSTETPTARMKLFPSFVNVNDCKDSFVMSDELLFNCVLPSLESAFVGDDIHRFFSFVNNFRLFNHLLNV